MYIPVKPPRPRALHRSFVAALLLLWPSLVLAAPAGTVVGLSGASVVESGGARGAVKLGQAVPVGGTVEVPADGKLKLRVAGGAVVSVAAGTGPPITAHGFAGA